MRGDRDACRRLRRVATVAVASDSSPLASARHRLRNTRAPRATAVASRPLMPKSAMDVVCTYGCKLTPLTVRVP
jgi:hypothetical protein